MMNSLEFKEWRKSQSTDIYDLTFAHPDDVFIFTRFTMHKPIECDNKEILYTETIDEAIGYIRHNFLYDILNDATDDLEMDFKSFFDERQKDAISLLYFWFKADKVKTDNNQLKELRKFCEEFNLEFSSRQETEYEIQILNGADMLRNFLIERFSYCENFDKKQLCSICTKELFVGKPLNDFINLLFNS